MRLFKWEWSWDSKPMRQPWHSILLAVFSLALFLASAFGYLSTNEFISTSNRATGVVTQMLQKEGAFYPRVSFVDRTGAQRIFESKLHATPPKYSVGETVVVLYSRQQPGEGKIENFFELWFFTLLTGILGLAPGIAALLTWVFRHRLFEQYQSSPNKPLKQRRTQESTRAS